MCYVLNENVGITEKNQFYNIHNITINLMWEKHQKFLTVLLNKQLFNLIFKSDNRIRLLKM